jgi:hypothetical protein
MRVSSASGASVAVLVSAALTIGLTSCSSGENGAGDGRDVFTNDQAGLSLTVPEGWHATIRRFTILLDPRERVVLTSFPVDDVARSRECSPNTVLARMPRTGIAAFLLEYMDDAARRHIDARPRHFRFRGTGPGCCFWPPPDARAYAFNFGDSGRAFQLLIAVGKDATPETRRLAIESLDSIRIEPCDRPLPNELEPRCRRPLPA